MSDLIGSKAIRKLHRLGNMGPGEIAHRARAKVYEEFDRISAGIRRGNKRPADVTQFKSYLNGIPAKRFYRGPRENLRPLIEARFPAWIDRAVKEAESLCRHEVSLLGHERVKLGCEIDWHRDPITGRTWEQLYWADYRLAEDIEGLDPKVIHELNRHQHLPRLAKAYYLTGEERYAVEAVNQLNGWIDQNPAGRGIHWHSSLEIGIRAISWLWTIFLLLPSRSLDEASAARVGNSLFDQLEHVHRYTSRFSSPNTHLIGEATALFIAGLVFRDQERPAVWLRDSAAILAETAEKQVLADGVYGELSSCYHCYALDFYQQALVLAKHNGFALPDSLSLKVQGMLQFLMHLTRPDGTLPLLGDDDGGRAVALVTRDYRSLQDGLCLGALLHRRGDFKHQAGTFYEEALWMLGGESADEFNQLESFAPAETKFLYPSAGYHVQRSGWGASDSHMVFDCGGLGMLAGAHAHADALSVTLFGGGRELLVDPGTYVYNCAPEWRDYFRSTRAHNTVSIDDLDQAEQGGAFRWKTGHHSQAAPAFTLPGVEYFEAEHDGYQRLPHGVTHRRRLLYVSPESWIVVDDFRGAGGHKFDLHYHFAPQVEVSQFRQNEDGVFVSAEQAGLIVHLFADRPFISAELIRGLTTSPAGWASSGYGQKQPCTLLHATLGGSVPAATITYLHRSTTSPDALPRGAPGIRRLTTEGGRGVASSCQHNGFEDIVVVSTNDAEIAVADLRMRGGFFWLRLEGGQLSQVLALEALSLVRDGLQIFRRSEPGPYRCVN